MALVPVVQACLMTQSVCEIEAGLGDESRYETLVSDCGLRWNRGRIGATQLRMASDPIPIEATLRPTVADRGGEDEELHDRHRDVVLDDVPNRLRLERLVLLADAHVRIRPSPRLIRIDLRSFESLRTRKEAVPLQQIQQCIKSHTTPFQQLVRDEGAKHRTECDGREEPVIDDPLHHGLMVDTRLPVEEDGRDTGHDIAECDTMPTARNVDT